MNRSKRVYTPAEIVVCRLGLDSLGFEIIRHPHPFKIVFGAGLVGVGVLTLPIPTGSIFLIGAGLGLLNSGGVDVFKILKQKKRRLIFWGWRLGFMLNDLKGGIKK